MPKAIVIYVRYVELMQTRLGKTLKFGLFALIGILLFEAVSRYVFNSPTTWSIEMSQFTLGAYFSLCGGYVLLSRSHVKMDILYSRWSPRRKAITDLATFALLATYIIVFLRGGINLIDYSLSTGEHTHTMWAPILAPIKIIIAVGAVLLLLQAIANFFRDLSLVKGKPLP